MQSDVSYSLVKIFHLKITKGVSVVALNNLNNTCFLYHQTGAPQGQVLTVFEHCNQIVCGHLPTASLQRRDITGQVGFPPCPGFWLLHFQLCHCPQPQEWWFCQWESSQRFGYHQMGPPWGEVLTDFEHCNQIVCGHLPTASLQRGDIAGQVGFP